MKTIIQITELKIRFPDVADSQHVAYSGSEKCLTINLLSKNNLKKSITS